jgi:hypothetical protein
MGLSINAGCRVVGSGLGRGGRGGPVVRSATLGVTLLRIVFLFLLTRRGVNLMFGTKLLEINVCFTDTECKTITRIHWDCRFGRNAVATHNVRR